MTSARERSQWMVELRRQQEALVKDLLPVLDALDRAEDHWRQVQHAPSGPANPEARPPVNGRGPWRALRRWLSGVSREPAHGAVSPTSDSATSLAHSAGEGVRLIRLALLEALQRHGLDVCESVGHPFDPGLMRAVGVRHGTPPGHVLEERVRGYRWQDNLLREAQVVVADN